MNKKGRILTALFVVFGFWAGSLRAARIITVDDDGPADFNTIQAAINDANNGDVVEIQPGRYTGPGNRDITFSDKSITVRSTNPEDPCVVVATVIDCNGTESDPHRGFDLSSTWRDCVLDGMTITNGYGPNAEWMEESSGGAIHTYQSNPIIRNCLIVNNSAQYGGGISWIESYGIISNCIFETNTASNSGGGLFSHAAALTIEHCSFAYNSTGGYGGGIGSWAGGPDVRHCTFTGNSSEGTYGLNGGGGIGCVQGVSLTSHCIFTGNHAYRGGGIHLFNIFGPNVTINNCSFHNNIASDYAGAVSYLSCGGDEAFIRNSIIWNNEPSNDSGIVSMPSGLCGAPFMYVDYSILQGDWQTSGRTNNCLVADPCFADAESGDYHLESQAGRWYADSGSWVQDDVTSPCIDAGNPYSPIGLEPFPNGGRINMGAYGGTVEASKSYFGKPPCETIVAGDVNGDCIVNFLDFCLMALHWSEDNSE